MHAEPSSFGRGQLGSTYPPLRTAAEQSLFAPDMLVRYDGKDREAVPVELAIERGAGYLTLSVVIVVILMAMNVAKGFRQHLLPIYFHIHISYDPGGSPPYEPGSHAMAEFKSSVDKIGGSSLDVGLARSYPCTLLSCWMGLFSKCSQGREYECYWM